MWQYFYNRNYHDSIAFIIFNYIIFFKQAKMEHIYIHEKTSRPSAQDVRRSSTKVYNKVQVSNMSRKTISRCPNKAMGSTTNNVN
jgi:hypothetical protein